MSDDVCVWFRNCNCAWGRLAPLLCKENKSEFQNLEEAYSWDPMSEMTWMKVLPIVWFKDPNWLACPVFVKV